MRFTSSYALVLGCLIAFYTNIVYAEQTNSGLTSLEIRAAGTYAEAISRGDDACFTRTFSEAIKLGTATVSVQASATQFKRVEGMESESINYFLDEEDRAALVPRSRFDDQFAAEIAPSLKNMLSNLTCVWEGTPTEPEEFTSCVAIGDAFGNLCCSGVLISSNVVITAAHCGIDCFAFIYVGTNFNNPQQKAKIQKFKRNDGYNILTGSNDLTVLFLKDCVTNVAILPIASSNLLADAFSLRIVGFGMTNSNVKSIGTKCKTDVPIVRNACLTPEQTLYYGCNSGIELVAGPAMLGDSCFGDSGGPAFIENDNKWYLAAITSRGLSHKASSQPCGFGSIYVRMYPYLEWLVKTATKYGGLPPQ